MSKIVIYVCVAFAVSAASAQDYSATLTKAQNDFTSAVTKYKGIIDAKLSTYSEKLPSPIIIEDQIRANKKLIDTYEKIVQEVLKDLETKDVVNHPDCAKKIDPIHPYVIERSNEIFNCNGVKPGTDRLQLVKKVASDKKFDIDAVDNDVKNCKPPVGLPFGRLLPSITCTSKREVKVVVLGNEALIGMEIEYRKIQNFVPYTCDIEKIPANFNSYATTKRNEFNQCFSTR